MHNTHATCVLSLLSLSLSLISTHLLFIVSLMFHCSVVFFHVVVISFFLFSPLFEVDGGALFVLCSVVLLGVVPKQQMIHDT